MGLWLQHGLNTIVLPSQEHRKVIPWNSQTLNQWQHLTRFFSLLWSGGLSLGPTCFGWEPWTIWQRRIGEGYGTGSPVEQVPFLWKIGKSDFVRGCERNANTILISTIGIRSSFCLNILSMKLIGWRCIRLSNTGRLILNWYPH